MAPQEMGVLVPGECTDSYYDDDAEDADDDDVDFLAHCRWGLSTDLQALWILVVSG